MIVVAVCLVFNVAMCRVYCRSNAGNGSLTSATSMLLSYVCDGRLTSVCYCVLCVCTVVVLTSATSILLSNAGVCVFYVSHFVLLF